MKIRPVGVELFHAHEDSSRFPQFSNTPNKASR